MPDLPFIIDVPIETVSEKYDQHLERRLSSMEGMFHDKQLIAICFLKMTAFYTKSMRFTGRK